jgi:hypothetical protein
MSSMQIDLRGMGKRREMARMHHYFTRFNVVSRLHFYSYYCVIVYLAGIDCLIVKLYARLAPS